MRQAAIAWKALRTVGLLAAAFAASPAAPARAIEPAPGDTDLGQLVLLVPEIKQAAPPAWVKPGVRVTFETVASGGGQIAATSLVQVDVIGLERDAVATCAAILLDARGVNNGPRYRLTATNSRLAPAGAAPGGYWVNPDALARAAGRTLDDRNFRMDVAPVDLPAPGEAARKAYVVHTTHKYAQIDRWYDARSGVLLRSSENTGDRRVSVSYRGTRQTDTRYYAAAAPPLDNGRRFSFAGQQVTPVVYQTVRQNAALTMEVSGRGGNWAIFDTTFALAGDGGSRLPSTTTGALAMRFFSPEAMAGFRPGQVLDQDPFTGRVTRLEGVQPDAVYVSTGDGVVVNSNGYDRRTGLITAFRVYDGANAGGPVTTELRLQR